jgi:hypothetical protein
VKTSGLRLVIAGLVSTALLGALAGPAVAETAGEQIQAKDRPKTTGPVLEESSQCSSEDLRGKAGDLLGTARTCVFLFSLNRLGGEYDLLNDYGAAWLQTTVEPAKGWCATKLESTLFTAPSMNVLDVTKRDAENFGKAADVTTKLALDAEGKALEEGTISQRYAAQPGTLGTQVDRSSGAEINTLWTGATSKRVALVSGFEYSWSTLETQPTDFRYGLSYLAFRSC